MEALQADTESAKREVESLKADLDILQRKYSLDQQSYYGNPDHASYKAGQAALDDEKGQIDAKQQEVADAQKRMDDMQAKLAAGTAAPVSAARATPRIRRHRILRQTNISK